MAAYLVNPGQPTRTSSLVRHSGLQKLGRTCFHSTQEAKPAPLPFPSAAPQNPLKILRPPPPSSVAMALARRLLRLRPHLGTLPLPSPNSSHLLGTRTYISDMRRSAFVDRLLRSVRSEISFLNNSAPPPSAPPPTPFTVEDRPGEQWARLRRVFPAAEGEEEEVRVDATLVDGALPPSRSGADTGGPPRLHISVKVEVSKAARPGVVLTFECSAWPDEMEVRRVFPVRRGGPALVQQYVGRQFSELDEEMQSAVQDYLEQIGVNDDLAAFLHAYMENKEHTELIRWLKNVECHIKK